jgi:hypothetical protein
MKPSNVLNFVFIVGCQRTGTTLIGNILGAQPHAFLIDETDGLYTWTDSVLNGQDKSVTSTLFTRCCQQARNNYRQPNKKCSKDGQLSESITHIILKAPNLTYSAKKIDQKFPNSFCIFTHRDIRDVVVSMSKLDWIPMVQNQLKLIKRDEILASRYANEILVIENPETQAHLRRARIVKIKTELSSSFNTPNIQKLEVGYEDLVQHPDEWINKIFQHVKLPNTSKNSSHMNVMMGWGPGLNFRRGSINAFSVGQWSKNLTSAQEQDIWEIVEPLMTKLNYERNPSSMRVSSEWDNIESDAKYRPIIATGRGGSGTRLLSSLLQSLGVFLGNSKNNSEDSLEWVGLFYKIAIERTRQQPNQVYEHWRHPLQATATEILSAQKWDGQQLWGWKLPETMLILPEVFDAFNQGVFIHIIRHPIDCALRRSHMTSRINNPLGNAVLNAAYDSLGWERNKIASDPTYIHNAASWHYQVSRASIFGREELGPTHYLEVRYEDICSDPLGVQDLLAKFLNIQTKTQPPCFEIDPARQRGWSPPDPRATQVWEICGELATQLGYQNIIQQDLNSS